MEENFNHVPVLLNECIEGLNIKPDGVYVDCTLGGGGHSGEIAKRLTTGRLISIDKDEDAIAYSKKRLEAPLTYSISASFAVVFQMSPGVPLE